MKYISFAKLRKEKNVLLLMIVLVAVIFIMSIIAANSIIPDASQTEKITIFLVFSGLAIIELLCVATFIKSYGNKKANITRDFIAGMSFFAVAFWLIIEPLVQIQEKFAGTYVLFALVLAFFGSKFIERSANEVKDTG